MEIMRRTSVKALGLVLTVPEISERSVVSLGFTEMRTFYFMRVSRGLNLFNEIVIFGEGRDLAERFASFNSGAVVDYLAVTGEEERRGRYSVNFLGGVE